MDTKQKKNNIVFNILAIITIIIFCIALCPRTLQNDTYYTIKIGEDIINNNGIDMKDHYSWNEDLPYTYPHWAYDCGMYLIYNLGQNSGIADGGMFFIYLSTIVFASILGILMYFTSVKVTKNKLVSYIITLASLYLLEEFLAARAQLVTFILFVLTILFIESFLESKNKWYLLGIVLISIAIANIHVAVWPFFFVLFMPYIVEYVIAYIADSHWIEKIKIFNEKDIIRNLEAKISKIKDPKKIEKLTKELEEAKERLEQAKEHYEVVKEKSEERKKKPYKVILKKNNAVLWLVLVLVICIFTGLLTPLKDTPYTYLVKTMQGNTTANISEHLPLKLYDNKPVMVVLALYLVMLIFTDTKIKLSDVFMLAGLVFLAFMSRRQTSLLILIGGFIFAKLLTSIVEKLDKEGCEKFIKFMTSIIGRICTLAFIVLLSLAIYKPIKEDPYINEKSYPVAAADWILENLDVENIKLFNEYNYGSYLLFRGIPVFIDSRADLYTPEFNGKKNEEGKYDGRDIFNDYVNTSAISTYYESKFDKYGVTHIILKDNTKLNMFLSRDKDYEKLYSDDDFVVYKRNK